MASKKASTKKVSTKKASTKKASTKKAASFANDFEKLMLKYRIKSLTIASTAESLKCPPGFHREIVQTQDPNGDTVFEPICVKDDD